jgi:hypothetical protein
MKKILAIGVASAALFGVSSVASAQEDCQNGWRTIKDQVIVRCDALPSAFAPAPILEGVTEAVTAPVVTAAAVGEAVTAPVEEPLFTGSIAAAPAQEDCLNGWRTIKDQVIVRCHAQPSAFGPAPILEGAAAVVTAPVVAAAAVGEAVTEPIEEPLFTGSIVAAPAQEDCLNGYRMIKDQVIVRCDALPSAFGPAPILEGAAAAVTAPVEAITEPVAKPAY